MHISNDRQSQNVDQNKAAINVAALFLYANNRRLSNGADLHVK